jgi:hypothetical protein
MLAHSALGHELAALARRSDTPFSLSIILFPTWRFCRELNDTIAAALRTTELHQSSRATKIKLKEAHTIGYKYWLQISTYYILAFLAYKSL